MAVTGSNTYTGSTTVNRGSTLQVSNATAQNPLGTGVVNVNGGLLDTTASNYTGTSPQLANLTFNLYGAGGTVTLNNTGVTLAGGTGNLRLSASSTVNLATSTLNFQGSNTNTTTTTQTLTTVNALGGNTIQVLAGSAANSDERPIRASSLAPCRRPAPPLRPPPPSSGPG